MIVMMFAHGCFKQLAWSEPKQVCETAKHKNQEKWQTCPKIDCVIVFKGMLVQNRGMFCFCVMFRLYLVRNLCHFGVFKLYFVWNLYGYILCMVVIMYMGMHFEMRQGVRMCRYPIVIWNKTCGKADGDANGGCRQVTLKPWCAVIYGFVDFSRVIVIEAEQGNSC